MILAVVLAVAGTALVGTFMRTCYPTTQTPDGMYYARMGGGLTAPRPYAFRVFASLIPPTFEAWSVAQWVSMILAAGFGAAWVHSMTGSMWLSVASVMVWATSPAHKRLWTWPALLDAPMMACAVIVAWCAFMGPLWALCAAALASMVHERAPVYAAAMMVMSGGTWDAAMVAAVPFVWVALRFPFTKAPTEQDPAWLHMGLVDFVRHHAQVAHSWRSWVLPLGVASLWMLSPSWPAALVAAMAYGGVLLAYDRNRIIAAATLPLAVVALGTVSPMWWPVLVVVNWFIIHDEV